MQILFERTCSSSGTLLCQEFWLSWGAASSKDFSSDWGFDGGLQMAMNSHRYFRTSSTYHSRFHRQDWTLHIGNSASFWNVLAFDSVNSFVMNSCKYKVRDRLEVEECAWSESYCFRSNTSRNSCLWNCGFSFRFELVCCPPKMPNGVN